MLDPNPKTLPMTCMQTTAAQDASPGCQADMRESSQSQMAVFLVPPSVDPVDVKAQILMQQPTAADEVSDL